MKRLIFFRARFPDDKQDPVTEEEAARVLAEANETFLRISDGKFSLAWEVSPVLFLTKDRGEYNGPGGFDRFLDDVRQAGIAAGYDYRDYDLDVVRHSGVTDFQGGNANLGTRGAQVQADGSTILVHELGHNLGLSHANLWRTGSPGISLGSPPLPSNYEQLPDPRTIPVYPDSALGHETITGLGYSAEYGDGSDIMGSGTVEFSAVHRYQLGWLTDAEIADTREGVSRYRIQATDGGAGGSALPRALRAGAPFQSPAGVSQYWVQLPPVETNSLRRPGVQLRWAGVSPDARSSLLLTPSAGMPGASDEALLAPGRTFSDPAAGIHITLLEIEAEGEPRWAELAVHHAVSPANRPPTVLLDASALAAGTNEPVTFTATAADPDGDALAWRWEFGDGTASTTPGHESKAWRRTGDFVVSVEVSDMKGGVARAHAAVRVGEPHTRRITGRVLDSAGEPVPGVRVHNGVTGNTDGKRRYASTHTDSLGRYTLAGLEPGTYTNGAFRLGFSIARQPPVTLADVDVENLDFTASPLPQVSVAGAPGVPESAGFTNLFVFARSGPVDEPLTVVYRLGGSATGGRDYVRPLVDRLIIPAGARTAALSIDLLDDQMGESDETIALEVAYPPTATRQDKEGNLVTVYYPGWELAEIDAQLQWVLTEPTYVPGIGSSATVTIQDDDPEAAQVVSVTSDDLYAVEEPLVTSSFTLRRTGAIEQQLAVHLRFGGSAENGVDYASLPGAVTFEPGQTEVILAVQPLPDGLAEGEEQVVLEVLPDAAYGIEIGSATIAIRDSAVVPQTLQAQRLLDGTLQLLLKGQPGSRLVLETKAGAMPWTPIRTNLLFNSDTVFVILPLGNQSHALFRTVRP